MCMGNAKETKTLPKHAWKVCVKYQGKLFTGPFSFTEISFGEWMKSKWEPSRKTGIAYKAGFHVFAHKDEAKQYKKDIYGKVGPRILFTTQVEIQGKAYEGKTSSGIFPKAAYLTYSVAEIKFTEDPS